MKLTKSELREMIREAIREELSGTPLTEAPFGLPGTVYFEVYETNDKTIRVANVTSKKAEMISNFGKTFYDFNTNNRDTNTVVYIMQAKMSAADQKKLAAMAGATLSSEDSAFVDSIQKGKAAEALYAISIMDTAGMYLDEAKDEFLVGSSELAWYDESSDTYDFNKLAKDSDFQKYLKTKAEEITKQHLK